MPLSPEQRLARHHAIGASDSAAALGLSRWKSPYDLYEEKRLPEPPPEVEVQGPMRWGHLLEPVLRQEYATQTGRAVAVPADEVTFRHTSCARMVAHPDGIAKDAGGDRLFEAKIARSGDGWGEPGSDQIPQAYLIQVQHALAILHAIAASTRDFRVADVAVLIGGSDFRIYEIPADAELQEMIVDGVREFWSYVEAGTPPPVDFKAPGALDIVRKMYPGTNGQTVVSTPELDAWRSVYDQAETWRALYEAQADGAKAHLLHVMGEATELKFADGKALRRSQVTRKGYTVESTTYITASFVKSRE